MATKSSNKKTSVKVRDLKAKKNVKGGALRRTGPSSAHKGGADLLWKGHNL